jgi:hypothetical protein
MSIIADRTTPCTDPRDLELESQFPPIPYEDASWDEEDGHWVSADAVRVYTRHFEFRFLGFFAYPPEKVYSSDQTARSGWTGIWSNSWMSAGKSMASGALRNS